MMNLNERVKKIGTYFQFMNVSMDAYYILTSFPNKWVVPSNASDTVKIMKKDDSPDTYYFYTDFNNGYEVLFDVIDEIIRQNKEIEEKYKLFNAKLNELKTLFENEDLSSLENMEFSLSLNNTKSEPEVKKEEEPKAEEEKSVEPEETVAEETPVVDEEKTKAKSKKKNKNVSSSVMNAAKNLIK